MRQLSPRNPLELIRTPAPTRFARRREVVEEVWWIKRHVRLWVVEVAPHRGHRFCFDPFEDLIGVQRRVGELGLEDEQQLVARARLEDEPVLDNSDKACRSEGDAELLHQLAPERLLAAFAEIDAPAKQTLETVTGDSVLAVGHEDGVGPRAADQGKADDSRGRAGHSPILPVMRRCDSLEILHFLDQVYLWS